MKIYLIYQMFQWSPETKFDEPQVIYGVTNEMQARKDCIKFQTEDNKCAAGRGYKIIYFYEEITLYS